MKDKDMATSGVAAVDRALRILDAFRPEDRSLTLTEISRRVDYYKSTTLRLAESLEKFGYLKRGEDGSYRIGYKPALLGSMYQRHFRSADVVLPVLRSLVDEWNEGASFFVREDDQRVCLHRVESGRAVRDTVREGDALAVGVGASGAVLMAFAGLPGEKYEKVRRELFAASFGERDPETAAYACPVFGERQRLVGAITLSGPRHRLQEMPLDAVRVSLTRAAAGLTTQFGGDASVFAESLLVQAA